MVLIIKKYYSNLNQVESYFFGDCLFISGAVLLSGGTKLSLSSLNSTGERS